MKALESENQLTVIQLPVLTDNYIYLLHDPESEETAAVDPALAEPVLDALAKRNWTLTYILNTHHHHDHVGGNLSLKQKTGCQIIASESDRHRIPGIDLAVTASDNLTLGNHSIQIIETPGHTNGHIVYYLPEDDLLFCGDTLFVMGCGRLFEGTAGQLWHSLQKLKQLPARTRIYCTHEYTESNARFALSVEPDNIVLQEKMAWVRRQRAQNQATVPSTLAEELATNPFLREDRHAIQASISMQNQPAVNIFARLRQLKDVF